jgi:hypothetical protein
MVGDLGVVAPINNMKILLLKIKKNKQDKSINNEQVEAY